MCAKPSSAISNVFRPPAITEADVAPLFEVPTSAFNAQDIDYLDGFREALDEFSQAGDDRGATRPASGEGNVLDELRDGIDIEVLTKHDQIWAACRTNVPLRNP